MAPTAHGYNLRVQLVSDASAVAAGFKSTAIFKEIQKQVETEGEKYVKKINGVIAFRVKGPDNKEVFWVVDAKNGKGSLELNSKQKPDCTVTMKDEDLVDLMMGKLNPNTRQIEDIREYGDSNEDSDYHANKG